ncbi:hypothetical protein B0H14DRAFT_2666173 [Mycena olivaceomarginata]|nr:hypothetical protein B0H14DRAFT_2666173 [Mycena olivaceomarginata]
MYLCVPFSTTRSCRPHGNAPSGSSYAPEQRSADPVQDAHALLAVYPMASANPSTHVTRHLSSLSLAGAPPSSLQPQYYAPYPPGNPPPYTEYPPEAQYLAADDSGYWESARGETSTMISQQVDPSYPYPSTWAPTNAQLSTFRPQRIRPSGPAALQPSCLLSHPSTAIDLVVVVQSPAFFDQFLEQKSRDLPPPQPRAEVLVHPSSTKIIRPRTPPQTLTESPKSKRALTPSPSPPALTPRKRKSVAQLDSPSVKRLHSPHPTPVPLTPSTASRATTTTPGSSFSTPSRPRATMSYVEIPHKAWAVTPKSSKRSMDPPDSPERPRRKLTALLDEIFDAEDALPPDVDLGSLPADYFSVATTVDCARPLLQPGVVKKLTKYIVQVGHPGKRARQGGRRRGHAAAEWAREGTDTGRCGHGCVAENAQNSGKECQGGGGSRSVCGSGAGERGECTGVAEEASRRAKGKRRSKSQSGDEGEEEEIKVDLARALETARDSIFAAECCLALLGAGRLTKQLYSEELITSCLSAVKNQLTKVIYPFVEASASIAAPGTSAILAHTLRTGAHKHPLSELFQALAAVLPRLSTLVGAEAVAMSDAIIIQGVYIAIGPFFVVDAGEEGAGAGAKKEGKGKERESVVIRTFGKSAMRGLRLEALGLIRTIFANHDDQRDWIIEEILTSLIKLSDTKQKAGQFRLRDGRSIRTVSALLLQLVQTSAHDVRIKATDIAKERHNKVLLRRQESFSESQSQTIVAEDFLDQEDLAEIRLYKSGLDSAKKAAKKIILFLNQRSGKGKATKNSNEAEYRAIFDNLISDLLAVLYWPEYPAASLLLSIATKFMLTSLDDVKTTQTDSNAAKTMALDHLGVIAARIRSSMLKFQPKDDSAPKSKPLMPMDELVTSIDAKRFDRLLAAHQDVAMHLTKRSSEEQAYDSARELTAATLGEELARGLERVNLWISSPEDDDNLTLREQSKLQPFGHKVKTALHGVWKDPVRDVFDIGSQEEAERIDRVAEEIGTIQLLRNSFQPILNIILVALDAPAIFMRTKALRALGQIVTSDPSVLAETNVRRAIESHLLDNSPAVRDAAVELIGKYMIESPEVAGDYYHKIADRMADTGLSVRKRVIKLLKAYYAVVDDNDRKTDICTRLVMRMVDEDDTVKDLAIKTIEELWFPVILASALKSQKGVTTNQDKSSLLSKVAVIMGTSAKFSDRQSPLEDILHQIIAEKQGNEAAALHARYTEICEALIDGLVDASDLPGFVSSTRIPRFLVPPAILSGSNASILLPYLKKPTNAEDQQTTDYLLKIFRASIPHMPRTAIKFGQELQKKLQPMVAQPASSLQGLQETVACFCAVVQCLTHEFARLVALFKSCDKRIGDSIKKAALGPIPPDNIRTLGVLIVIIALIGEHCDFARIRREAPGALMAGTNTYTRQTPIVEHIYGSLLQLYEKCGNEDLRGRILQCLGFLFRAQPSLMTMDRSSVIMDNIFSSSDEERRGRLLKIIQEFLISEAAKHSAKTERCLIDIPFTAFLGKVKPTDINMDELVGNTDGFADSGVSSAVVQRYMPQILQAALSQHPQIQVAAIDILTFTIKQGLAHPLESFPVIHGSLLNTRYIQSARKSFDYQRGVTQDVQGFRLQPTPIALLQRWYSLVREKRATRQDFLKSLVKVFNLPRQDEATQDEVDFARYMAENLASFDYKTQEEAVTVIKDLTVVLSVDGTRLLEIISPSHLLSHLRGAAAPEAMEVDGQGDEQDNRPRMRASVIIGMVMLLKAHLKNLYSLSEEFCSGQETAAGDKAVTKRHEKPIAWTRLPFATTPILTTSDGDAQKAQFIEVWNEDGVSAEPEDAEFS